MKKIATVLLAMLLVCVLVCAVACGNDADGNDEGNSENVNNGGEANGDNGSGENPGTEPSDTGARTLVAYFSATGNTKPLAQYIANCTGATLFEIEAKEPYTADDLRYYTNCRADREQNDPSARPEIKNKVENMAQYDVVFVGYPIWHAQAPKIVYTFLESYDFAGKTVVPFCTSASSPVGTSASNLHPLAPNADWKDGTRFAVGTDEATIKAWVDKLDLNKNKEGTTVKVHCGNNVLEMVPADNASAKAFVEKLKGGDVTVKMDDYGNFEKVGALGFSLVRSDTQITTLPGDVILYQGSNITIYYDTNSWDFTLLGKIPNMTRESMLEFIGGKGEVSVTFSLK